MTNPPADWQLPPGVERGLWSYLHDADLARCYDSQLAGTPLIALDLAFCENHFESPGRLIDLGCGTGRLLLPFAKRGYWTLGVDLSAQMLRVVADKAAAAGVQVATLQANLVALDGLADESIDYAACLFSTLGMIHGANHRQRAVEHAFRLLQPGGKFVLHVHNLWFSLWSRQGRRWILSNCWQALRGKASAGDCLMPAHDGLPPIALHLFTHRQALRLLKSVGFEVVEVLPLGLRADGRLSRPRWFGTLRAYGYLFAAHKP